MLVTLQRFALFVLQGEYYYFFDNKPEALPVYVEKAKQLELFAYWPYPELESSIISEFDSQHRTGYDCIGVSII